MMIGIFIGIDPVTLGNTSGNTAIIQGTQLDQMNQSFDDTVGTWGDQ
jgi:hypothetical protein